MNQGVVQADSELEMPYDKRHKRSFLKENSFSKVWWVLQLNLKNPFSISPPLIFNLIMYI